MAFNVVIKETGMPELIVSLDRYKGKIQKITNEMGLKIAKAYQSEMLREVNSQGLRFTGGLARHLSRPITKVSGGKKKIYTFKVPQYAINLAFMKPHDVKLKGRPQLRDWAQQKGIGNVRAIRVRPKNWVTPASKRASAKIRKIISDQMRRLSGGK